MDNLWITFAKYMESARVTGVTGVWFLVFVAMPGKKVIFAK